MLKKWFIAALVSICMSHVYAMQHQIIKVDNISYDVIKADHLQQLRLFLKDPKNARYYQKFAHIQKMLPACEQLSFAMNAGMYHPDFQPVGLYVEEGKEIVELNEAQGFGNFFMQPNGVLAWNDKYAVIKTTTDYKSMRFKPRFATQSGPMLVYKGQVNRQFVADSNSLKIRNGVGVRNNQLYFVISQKRVNFYQFAQFFKQNLKIDNALYLDGSISSLYSTQTKRQDKTFNLGPIVAEIAQENCN
ncbi:phosphodiester glycosidase family protein [Acinetobacter sp. WCHA39]|uniref:phosphodiester glycosidase family protein n=1 Tax=Acinetobacter sp. WCHA39 TaxID=2004648 RepID=UPI000B3C9D63|nr:phosphodiester glycosidase family protein [Acinetobacter sp. WCHA39]